MHQEPRKNNDDPEILVRVENVSKKFCLDLKRSLWYGVKDLTNEMLGRPYGGREELRQDEFWAVKDVSFELKRGECLGLIGRNGAGKTTLLRMLNGLIKPDKGRIEIRGRVGALIALGAGFNPILTGRENIYVNAAVLGLSKKQTDAKLEEIVEFAELGDFIDSPVQSYSSGMAVRLGFSIAAILIRPDVLFLDEVLAVGDIGFTIKCLNIVRRLTIEAAVVFVSHNMQFISAFCTRVLVMERGSALLDSIKTADGIDCYYGLVKHDVQISGTGEARVLSLDLVVNGQTLAEEEAVISRGVSATVVLGLEVDQQLRAASIILSVHDEAQAPLICMPIFDSKSCLIQLAPGRHRLEIPLGVLDLNTGKYSFVIALRDADTSVILARKQGLRPFRISSEKTYWGKIIRPVVLNHRQSSGVAANE
jgi:lipopolysaccharide transport system ATP-binding protein